MSNFSVVIETCAAIYLLWLASVTSTENLRSSAVFKFIPAALAFLLGFRVFGRLMGWPI